ncbi:hypothetical protein [Neomoorella thermoacetica]|uniref:hypothetical protein n=1 Tax=Neomoorella thermoacetica TaxID=1525 RepID=UPI00084BFDBE|nr:hypothetical protein [Moorella thermoacetica]
MHLEDIQAGTLLRGPIFPEEVRVLAVKPLGSNRIKLEAVGVGSRRYYDPVLTLEELGELECAGTSAFDFSGDPERAFLYLEGLRIRNAFQFDPLYGVNISRVDALPHQIEAVYHYILKNPASVSFSPTIRAQERK